MKVQSAAASIAVLSLTLLSPGILSAQTSADAQNSQSPQNGQNNAPTQGASNEAMQMVPAQAAVVKAINAKKEQPGSPVVVSLAKKVRLKNGTELPTGTKIIGQVATDDMQMSAASKLAIRFTEAKLKNGTSVPIKATIVAVYPPEDSSLSSMPEPAGLQENNGWTALMLQIDQVNGLSGIELHSRIGGQNSGVFLSKKGNVSIGEGCEFALAIAAANGNQQSSNGPGGN
jgi:hypothetical protein